MVSTQYSVRIAAILATIVLLLLLPIKSVSQNLYEGVQLDGIITEVSTDYYCNQSPVNSVNAYNCDTARGPTFPYLTDGNHKTFYNGWNPDTNSQTSAGVAQSFNIPVVLTGVIIQVPEGDVYHDPASFSVEATALDNTTFVLKNATDMSTDAKQTFDLSCPKPIKSVKITFTRRSQFQIWVSELTWYGASVGQVSLYPLADNGNTAGEGSLNAFDNDPSTKWNAASSYSWVNVDAGSVATIYGIQVRTAGDGLHDISQFIWSWFDITTNTWTQHLFTATTGTNTLQYFPLPTFVNARYYSFTIASTGGNQAWVYDINVFGVYPASHTQLPLQTTSLVKRHATIGCTGCPPSPYPLCNGSSVCSDYLVFDLGSIVRVKSIEVNSSVAVPQNVELTLDALLPAATGPGQVWTMIASVPFAPNVVGFWFASIASAVDARHYRISLNSVDVPFGTFRVSFYGSNAVQIENSHLGTTDWVLRKPTPTLANGGKIRADPAGIEGYASEVSVTSGSTIDLYVSTMKPTYSLQVYRIGWYSGMGGRRVDNGTGVNIPNPVTPNNVQPMPAPDTTNGDLIDCQWVNPYRLLVPSNWTSGIYLVQLTSPSWNGISPLQPDHFQSYIIFTVRDDSRTAALLFQQSSSTYQAYNAWGGISDYDVRSPLRNGVRGSTLSYNRPYHGILSTKGNITWGAYAANNPNIRDAGYGTGAGTFFTFAQMYEYPGSITTRAWEYSMVRFLEREGYDVTYCTNTDIDRVGDILDRHRVLLSVGHDEYWTPSARHLVERSAREGRLSFALFSGNNVWGGIELLPDTFGHLQRIQIPAFRYPFNVGDNRNISVDKLPDLFYMVDDAMRSDYCDQSFVGNSWTLAGVDKLMSMSYDTFSPNGTVKPGRRTPPFLVPGGAAYTNLGRLGGYETDSWKGYFVNDDANDEAAYINCAPPEQAIEVMSDREHDHINATRPGALGVLYRPKPFRSSAPVNTFIFNAATVQFSFGLDNGFASPGNFDQDIALSKQALISATQANANAQAVTRKMLRLLTGQTLELKLAEGV